MILSWCYYKSSLIPMSGFHFFFNLRKVQEKFQKGLTKINNSTNSNQIQIKANQTLFKRRYTKGFCCARAVFQPLNIKFVKSIPIWIILHAFNFSIIKVSYLREINIYLLNDKNLIAGHKTNFLEVIEDSTTHITDLNNMGPT